MQISVHNHVNHIIISYHNITYKYLNHILQNSTYLCQLLIVLQLYFSDTRMHHLNKHKKQKNDWKDKPAANKYEKKKEEKQALHHLKLS